MESIVCLYFYNILYLYIIYIFVSKTNLLRYLFFVLLNIVFLYFIEYKLVGFISHMGTSTMVGHYVCHLLKNNRWVIYNDDKVCIKNIK